MPTVKLTDEAWYAYQTEQVLECLHAWLPHGGMTVAEVKARLSACGFGHTAAEWSEIAQRLVVAGEIEIS